MTRSYSICYIFIHAVICVDRHAKEHPDRVALIWEKDKPGETERITYR